MEPKELPPPAQLMKFIVGKWISKPIYVAAELGIADKLAKGPRSIDELARMSQTDAPTLYRVLRALASVGIFSEGRDGRFELTPMAEFLKTGMMRSMALMFNADWNDHAWGCLLDSVRTGGTAFEKAHGMSLMEWLGKNPRQAAVLHEANAVKAAHTHRVIVDAYDFSGIDTLVDIGGGYGTLMAAVLKAHPDMKGIVADRPEVVDGARRIIQEQSLDHRCTAEVCDFFHSVPPGGDAYLLSHVLHDWEDAPCHKILRNCSAAMSPGGRLLVVEMIIPPGNEPAVAKLLDLEMLVITGGRERTEEEFKTLFGACGIEMSRVIPTQENICIIEGIRN
jgi:hypothetical protein